jgi:hypothetical protein
MMHLSDYYLQVGNYAEARRHAEAAGDAGTTSPHENLARIALLEGDLDAAEREARAALEKYPGKRVPHLILARVRHDRHDYAGALAEVDLAARPRAGGENAPLENLNYLRGDSLARMGRGAEAEAAFLQEIREYASQGREAEARKALSDLVREVNSPDAYFAAIKTYEILGDPRAAGELKAAQRRAFPGAKELKETGG